jgi:hypothetical protein
MRLWISSVAKEGLLKFSSINTGITLALLFKAYSISSKTYALAREALLIRKITKPLEIASSIAFLMLFAHS